MTDNKTDYTVTSLLSQKSESQRVLRNYLAFMKTRGTLVQCIRSGNGGEYAGYNTIELMKEYGVKWEPTAPYDPSQNGVAERCFRTLFERTHSILANAKSNSTIWGEAISTVTYLKNEVLPKDLTK